MDIYDRARAQTYKEKQYKGRLLGFLYNKSLGRILLKAATSRLFSRAYAIYMGSKWSKKKIAPFIKQYGVIMDDYKKGGYKSFNHFFARKILPNKRPFSKRPQDLIAIADSKLTYYKIDGKLRLYIKGSRYSVSRLLKSQKAAEKFKGGSCLVFRLTVDDYHRYCYFDNGETLYTKKINGRLHTVSPISNGKIPVFHENYREASILKTENFGYVAQIEVGALLVGKINNYNKPSFKKGAEKGFFEMGGSTIILFFTKGKIKIDSDILYYSGKGIETKVKMGMAVGVKYYG
jgi:phosphatidylserine decarboxylase